MQGTVTENNDSSKCQTNKQMINLDKNNPSLFTGSIVFSAQMLMVSGNWLKAALGHFHPLIVLTVVGL